jgi:hypothetical protein
MQTEMQELIEAAEAAYAAMAGNNSPFDPEVWSKAVLGLEWGIAAARASEGGWIDCKQDPAPECEPLLIVWKGVVQHLTYTLSDGGWYPHHADHDDYEPIEDGETTVTHYRHLPSPPLSIETPK